MLSLLAQEQFAAVHLFYNNDDFLRRASAVLKALRERGDETEVKYECITAPDPTDYETLYEQMQHRVLELRKQQGEQTQFSSSFQKRSTRWWRVGTLTSSNALLGYKEACREGIGQEAPWEDFLEYFQTILMVLDSLNLGLVLMIDEFDKLQEGIDNKVTSPQIPENIR